MFGRSQQSLPKVEAGKRSVRWGKGGRKEAG